MLTHRTTLVWDPSKRDTFAGVLSCMVFLRDLRVTSLAPLSDADLSFLASLVPSSVTRVEIAAPHGEGVHAVQGPGLSAIAEATGGHLAELSVEGLGCLETLQLRSGALRRLRVAQCTSLSKVDLSCPGLQALELHMAPVLQTPLRPPATVR